MSVFILDAKQLSAQSQLEIFNQKLKMKNLLDENGKISLKNLKNKDGLSDLSWDAYLIERLSDENLSLRYGEDFDNLADITHSRNKIYEYEQYHFALKNMAKFSLDGAKKLIYVRDIYEQDEIKIYDDGKLLATINFKQHLEKIFAKHELDMGTKITQEQAERLHHDALVIDDKNGTFVLFEAKIIYDGRLQIYEYDILKNGIYFVTK